MRKFTALAALVAAVTLTACSAPVALTSPAQAFRDSIQHSGTSYETMPDAAIDEMGMYICRHYAAGFTTQDLRNGDGERLAMAGESALATICKAPQG